MEAKHLAETVFAVLNEQAPAFKEPVLLNTPLGADGLGLDSIAILELVLELEDRTGLRLRDENLTAQSLSTTGSLILYLEQSVLE